MMRAGFKLFVLICAMLLVTGCASDQEKAQKFLDQGQSAYDSAQYGEAVIQVKNAIKLSPKTFQELRLCCGCCCPFFRLGSLISITFQ